MLSAERQIEQLCRGVVDLHTRAELQERLTAGKLLRVKGRGAPKLNGGGKGDLLARLRVTVPKKLSKAEKEALEAYGDVLREQPRQDLTRSAR